LWRLRNGIGCCDYDARAYHSWIIPQRYWQRRRFAIIESMLRKHRAILDIGCGSSEIIRSLPAMVGLDVNVGKLRFLRSTNPRLVRGSAFALPFRRGSFSTVVCSEVIEHIPMNDSLFEEMARVLEPGGTLVLGTPDYDSRLWIWIEYLYKRLMPGGYADEHISHYTSAGLVDLLRRFGFEVVSKQSILGAEVIFECKKHS
jgi:ubiquinone/menaquinone biosynthesis C-methylase UbiE